MFKSSHNLKLFTKENIHLIKHFMNFQIFIRILKKPSLFNSILTFRYSSNLLQISKNQYAVLYIKVILISLYYTEENVSLNFMLLFRIWQ